MSFVAGWNRYATGPSGHRVTWRGNPQRYLNWSGQVGTVVYRSPGGKYNDEISGTTRDSLGAVVGSCRVELFSTGGDTPRATTTSDATTGTFSFAMPGSAPFFLVAYKAGSPDIAGTTVNTLIPTAL